MFLILGLTINNSLILFTERICDKNATCVYYNKQQILNQHNFTTHTHTAIPQKNLTYRINKGNFVIYLTPKTILIKFTGIHRLQPIQEQIKPLKIISIKIKF